MAKKIKSDEKKLTKKSKELNKETVKVNTEIKVLDKSPNKFSDIVNKIIKRNSFRPYPDINNTPN